MNKIASKARARGEQGDVRNSLVQRATDMLMGELDSRRPWTVKEICDEYGGKILALFNEQLGVITSGDTGEINEQVKTFNGRTAGDNASRNWRRKKTIINGHNENHVWRGRS